ncbi:hypothetical protein KAU32_09695 [bacterium]|nr:hypothetical protein [bacterium]
MKTILSQPEKNTIKAMMSLPVVPLHIHWDGSVPAASIYNFYAKKNEGLFLPEKDFFGNVIKYRNEGDRIIDSPEKLMTFQQDMRKYNITDVFLPSINMMQTKEDLFAMAFAHCSYLRSQNIRFAETRFAPQYHTKAGLGIEEIISISLDAFQKAYEQTGVKVGLILSLDRGSDPGYTEDLVREFLKFEGRILGIDLACEETLNPPEKHLKAFELTFDTEIKRTVHTGEMCTQEENLDNTLTVLKQFRLSGIGHAIPLCKGSHKGSDMIEMMIEQDIRLESNPVSNYNFFIESLDDLHLDRLLDAGVKVTLNPDDPAMWKYGDNACVMSFMYDLYGKEFIFRTCRNSIESSWLLNDKERKGLLLELENIVQKFKVMK